MIEMIVMGCSLVLMFLYMSFHETIDNIFTKEHK